MASGKTNHALATAYLRPRYHGWNTQWNFWFLPRDATATAELEAYWLDKGRALPPKKFKGLTEMLCGPLWLSGVDSIVTRSSSHQANNYSNLLGKPTSSLIRMHHHVLLVQDCGGWWSSACRCRSWLQLHVTAAGFLFCFTTLNLCCGAVLQETVLDNQYRIIIIFAFILGL